jgi:hypothetical protein
MEERKKLARSAFLCKQQLFDQPMESIKKDLENPEVYLDPFHYSHLLSVLYNCNIFTFTKLKNEKDPILMIEKHIQGLYKFIKSKKYTVIIYEHFGSTTDRLKNPKCELIIRLTPGTSINSIKDFTHSLEVYRAMNKLYNNTFVQTSNTVNVILSTTFLNNIIYGQSVDNYGKTRFLELSPGYFVMTSPLPIFDMKVVGIDFIKKKYMTLKDTIQLMEKFDLKPKRLCVQDEIIVEMECQNGNVMFYLPLKTRYNTQATQNIFRNENQPNIYTIKNFMNMDGNDYINEYIEKRKLAKVLKENFIFLYSIYMYQTENGNIIDFVDSNIVVSKEYEYPDEIDLNLSTNNLFINEGVMTMHNQEILKKMIYQLRLELNKDMSRVMDYYQSTKITDFYNEVSDFNQYPGEIVVKGITTLQNWDLISSMDYRIYKNIEPSRIKYFIRNEKIFGDKSIYIATTFTSIQKGFKTLYNSDEIPDFYLYTYSETGEIKKYLRKGKGNQIHPEIILGFIYNLEPIYVFVTKFIR